MAKATKRAANDSAAMGIADGGLFLLLLCDQSLAMEAVASEIIK